MDPTVENTKKSQKYWFFIKYVNNDQYHYLDPLKRIQVYINYLDPKYTKSKLKALIGQEKYHKIRDLDIQGHEMTELPKELPSSLERFECMNNRFTSLPPLPNKLKYLDISGNPISELPKLPDSLEELHIGYTNVSELPTSFPPRLKVLYCTGAPMREDTINRIQKCNFELLFQKHRRSRLTYSRINILSSKSNNFTYEKQTPYKKSIVDQKLIRPDPTIPVPKKKKVVELELSQLEFDMVEVSSDEDIPYNGGDKSLDVSRQEKIDLEEEDISIKVEEDEAPDCWDSSDGE